jgi:hypothetical protein
LPFRKQQQSKTTKTDVKPIQTKRNVLTSFSKAEEERKRLRIDAQLPILPQ